MCKHGYLTKGVIISGRTDQCLCYKDIDLCIYAFIFFNLK